MVTFLYSQHISALVSLSYCFCCCYGGGRNIYNYQTRMQHFFHFYVGDSNKFFGSLVIGCYGRRKGC